ncbi:esterase/lipase family protein [Neorhodopirellula pilleata]|nr:lipase [Neorhodopirellula pilleata]
MAALLLMTALAISALESHRAVGQSEGDSMANRFHVPMPTLGGTQIWSDRMHRAGYRVQYNELTKHSRLLDPRNVRRGWGTEAEMEHLLDEYCPEPPYPTSKPIVVLMHGLMRTDGSMKSLEGKFQEAGYEQTIRFGYASTRSPLAQSADNLRRVLEGQHRDAEFCFVGHSMGNIVLRHLVGDLQRQGDPVKVLPRCRAMVMLGPPNQGAMIARRLATTGVFEWVVGPGGMELGPRWSEIEDRLATPPFPFAIAAGKFEAGRIRNPLVEGDSDFVVSLDEAKLDGAETIQEFPVLHSFLMNDPDVQKWTVDFIESKLAGE